METTRMKMEYRKQTDNVGVRWNKLSNVDELIWSGKYTIKISDDDGSSQLPFLLGNDETISLFVQDHVKEGTNENGRTIVQTITRVECSCGKVSTYTRTRYNDGGAHVWSQWTAVSEIPVATNTSLGGVIIGDGLSVNTEGKVSVDGRYFEGNNFDKVNFAIYTNALNSQTGGNLFDKNSAGILTGKIFADDSGNFKDREDCDTSDYMAVVPGETYSCTQIVRKPSGYDLDKKFKKAIDYSNGVFQIPEGVYWIRMSYVQSWANSWCVNKGTEVLPVGQRAFGLMRTEKLYGNAVTIDKLSHDVQVLIDEVPSFGLKLIKLAGFGTLYGGSTGVTGDGQYFVSTYDKKLYVSSNFVSPNSFTTTEVPFIDGAIYTYNNELYLYNGTEVVKAAAPLEKKMDNLFTDYAAITNGTPLMDTATNTFTIPKSAYVSAAGKGFVLLSKDIVVLKDSSYWSSQYIVLNLEDEMARTVDSKAMLSLDEKEVVIALVRWGHGVINGNFFSYSLNGEMIELKPLTSLPAFKDEVEEAIVAIEGKVDTSFTDYAVLTTKNPILDTAAKTFTLPKGIYISSPSLKKGFALPSDITIEADFSSGWYTHYIVLDTTTLTMRIAPSNARLALSNTEVVVVLLRWEADTGILSGNLYSYIKDGVEIEFKPTTSLQQLKEDIGQEVNSMTAAPMMYNPPVNLLKENLRILDIGNSYTTDVTHYLPEIAAAAGATTGYSLYKATRSGGSFKNWVDIYNDMDSEGNYLNHVAGDSVEGISTGNSAAGDGSRFRNALLNGKWDLIIIHQASHYATDFNSWNGKTNAGYLKDLIQIIRQTNPQATIGFYLIHSYWSGYSGNSEKSSLERWRNIAAATKKMCLNYGIDFVIPYGTAVQNLRATSLNDGSDFSTDGTHLADGLGDYVAACCYWQSMFAPRFGSIVGNGFRKTDLDENTKGVKNITDETASIAQKAAMWATYNWYEVINPEQPL